MPVHGTLGKTSQTLSGGFRVLDNDHLGSTKTLQLSIGAVCDLISKIGLRGSLPAESVHGICRIEPRRRDGAGIEWMLLHGLDRASETVGEARMVRKDFGAEVVTPKMNL